MALRVTTSSRGLAQAAPRQLVKPASRYFFATLAHHSTCSSNGMVWMAARSAASFQLKCVCASTMPGISVAPAPSITVAPAGEIGAVLRPT